MPVGFGTLADVPATFVTKTLSCTTVPAWTDVTTVWFVSWMSVRAAASAQFFVAGPEFGADAVGGTRQRDAADGERSSMR